MEQLTALSFSLQWAPMWKQDAAFKWLKILRGDSNSRIGSLPSQPYTFNIIIIYSWPTINAPGSCSTICFQKCPCWNCRWCLQFSLSVCLHLRQGCWPSCFYGETKDSAFNEATPTYAQNISIFTFVSAQEMILSFQGRKVPFNGFYIKLSDLSPQNHKLHSQMLKKNLKLAGVAKIQSAKQIEIL